MNILSYLSPTDLYQIFPDRDQTQDIITRFKTLFRQRGIDPDTFLKILTRHGAVVSGSFVLQAILDKSWPESDIDIYVESDPSALIKAIKTLLNIKLENKIIFHEYENLVPVLDVYNLWEKQENYQIFGYETELEPEPAPKPDEKKYKIQIIHTENIDQCIKSFDFEFCRNMSDGHTVKINYPELVYKMQCIIDIPENYIKSRLNKYQERGFRILYIDNPNQDLIVHFYHKLTTNQKIKLLNHDLDSFLIDLIKRDILNNKSVKIENNWRFMSESDKITLLRDHGYIVDEEKKQVKFYVCSCDNPKKHYDYCEFNSEKSMKGGESYIITEMLKHAKKCGIFRHIWLCISDLHDIVLNQNGTIYYLNTNSVQIK
jgi:hypothetical protein